MKDALVVAELMDGKARKSTLSAVAFAKELGGAFDILVIGEGSAGAATELAGFGARKILRAEIAGGYLCEKYAATVASQAEAGAYGFVAAPGSAYGKDLMPRVAAKLGAGIASDIVGIQKDGDNVGYRRSMYAGNLLGIVTITSPTHAVTVRLSDFAAAQPSGGDSPVEEVEVVADAAAERIEFVRLDAVKSERPDLPSAEVVVAGGRALGSRENFKNVLEPLADALGAAVGASRAACDAGYIAGDLQIGQTGKVVAPKLYIAVGISGAIQHLAGMKDSKTIVAINKDKEAPIAEVADYFLVSDLFESVPALTEALKKLIATR